MAAAAAARTQALAPLPLALAQHIFALLPPDSRARAACVARAWRDTIANPAVWSRLELSDDVAAGASVEELYEALDNASSRAAGQLYRLAVWNNVIPDMLLDVINRNADSLRELRVGHVFYTGDEVPDDSGD